MRKLILFALFFVSCISEAQQISISGKITNEKNKPLHGVEVELKQEMKAVISDTNGNYKISIPKSKGVLIFRFAGYIKQVIEIIDDTIVNIQMQQDQSSLNEVVVMGYSTQKRADLTGSIGSVSQKDIKSNPVQAMQGRIPGAQISGNRPLPSSSQIRIRGVGSITRSSDNVYENTESYDKIIEIGFRESKRHPLSTFSIDVDKAAYTNIRRYLNNGQMPPKDAVRMEEMINYFSYKYPQPQGSHPFAIKTEYSECPWSKEHKLLHIGLQGKQIELKNLPPSNLVFLIDVSGSMSDQNKLPLVQSGLKLLVKQLRKEDKVAIVVYAGAAGLALPSTSGENKDDILAAIQNLSAGGSTAGGEGIELAYKVAVENFIKEGNNRVILATDGDFNVGVSSDEEMEKLIEKKRETGVFLTCLGFGMGNYKDSKLEKLADKGNGNYAYIDNIQEAGRIFVKEFGGTIYTIAKDVKIQIEFNPAQIKSYRLLGYEDRVLQTEDFRNDKKDAGELGSGHTVTAIYEVVLKEDKFRISDSDTLKYQSMELKNTSGMNEVATIKFRYKEPQEKSSKEIIHPIINQEISLEQSSDNFKFSAAVAEFGLLLRDSEYKGKSSYKQVLDLAKKSKGMDEDGYRAEFIRLVESLDNL